MKIAFDMSILTGLSEAILGTSLAFYRGQKGLSLENFEKKSEKEFAGPRGPGVKKKFEKKPRKSRK